MDHNLAVVVVVADSQSFDVLMGELLNVNKKLHTFIDELSEWDISSS